MSSRESWGVKPVGALAVLGAVVVTLVQALGAGCAYRQTELDTIDRLDRLRFAACQRYILRGFCEDHSDCRRWAPRSYMAEQPSRRKQWLLGYGCPDSVLARAERGAAPPVEVGR